MPVVQTIASAPRALSALGLLGGLLLGACHATPPASKPEPSRPATTPEARTPQALMDLITTEIGTARCEQDSQCRSLPVGHKACGGPAGHLAWSSLVSDQGRLQALAREHALATQAAQARAGLMSDCMLVSDPGARCNAQTQRCELNPRGRSGPSAM